MTTQVQMRGNIRTTQEARTLVSRELDINTTDNRLAMHDGLTVGGIQIPNQFDVINQRYQYSSATGTNALTITVPKTPAAYAVGQAFEFIATATNTGAVTMNVNSLGAKSVKKLNIKDATIDAVEAGDIVNGGIYRIVYNGTDFQITSGASSAAGGGLVPIARQTLSTEPHDTGAIFTSEYDNYYLVISDFRGTSGSSDLLIQFIETGGTVITSGYRHYSNQVFLANTGGSGINRGQSAASIITQIEPGTTADHQGSVRMWVQNPLKGDEHFIKFEGLYMKGGTTAAWSEGAGNRAVNNTIEGLRLLLGSGSFESGVLDIYGYTIPT